MDDNTPSPSAPKRSKPSSATHEDEPMVDSKEKGSSSVLDPECSENRRTIFDLLDELGKPKLEEEFKRHFKYLTKDDWKYSPACGQAFVTAIGVKKFEDTFTYEDQRNLIKNGDIKCWDITLLGSAIRVTNNNKMPKKNRQRILDSVTTLVRVRNPASHTPGQVFHNQKFDQLFQESKSALKMFGYTDEDIDKALQRITGGRPVFTCEAPVKEFCGREGVLKACKEAIEGCSAKNMIEDKIVVIHGFGGMGKSQIGKCMAQRLRSDNPHYSDLSFDVVYWFDAQTVAGLKTGFKNLARSLGIKHKLSDSDELSFEDISTIYTHLDTWYNGKVLFIFDNAEQMEAKNEVFGLNTYLDPDNRCGKPVFLVTSRVPWHDWVNPSNCIKIDELTHDDRRTCLLHYMGIQANNLLEEPALEEAIDSLLEITGGHPLGLALMGSAMAKRAQEVTLNRSSWVQIVNAYLDLLRAKPRAELSEEDKYREGVKKICEYTLAQIDDGSSESILTTLLGVVAFLHPDYIDLDVVQGICYVDDEKYERPDVEYIRWKHLHVDIRKAINLLRDYSLIDLHTVEYFDNRREWLKIHRVVQKCIRDICLEWAHARNPLQKICKFLRSTAQHTYTYLDHHVLFLLRLHEDSPTDPNPLDPSSIIELTSWLDLYRYDWDDKGNRLLPRISVEAMGTRMVNEQEHNALELIHQRFIHCKDKDWNLIENRARTLYGSTCLAPEWLIEVCSEMISGYVLKKSSIFSYAVHPHTNSIVVRVSRLILQCYRELPETLTIRTPENVLYVLGVSVLAGEKIDHGIINRVFLEAGLNGFWDEYYEVYYKVAGFFKDEWLSGLFPPSGSSFFTQSFQSLAEQKLMQFVKSVSRLPILRLLEAASKNPDLHAQLVKEIDGSDCAFWKFTKKVLWMYSVVSMDVINVITVWLQFFCEDENVYNSYGERLVMEVEDWFERVKIFYKRSCEIDYPNVNFLESATPQLPYLTERTKIWIEKLRERG